MHTFFECIICMGFTCLQPGKPPSNNDTCKYVLYGGKFLMVQNFCRVAILAFEEIFVVLNFAPVLEQDHTCHQLADMCEALGWMFSWFLFLRQPHYPWKPWISHHAKISHYNTLEASLERRNIEECALRSYLSIVLDIKSSRHVWLVPPTMSSPL